MRFFLGAHHADWLARAGVPLFVSRRTLAPRRRLPRAVAPWALDSGGFTELYARRRGSQVARLRAEYDRHSFIARIALFGGFDGVELERTQEPAAARVQSECSHKSCANCLDYAIEWLQGVPAVK